MNTAATSSERSHAERQPHPSPHRGRVRYLTIWFGLIGAPLAWILQEAVNVGLSGYACYPRDVPLAEPLWPQLGSITLGVEVIAIVVCIGAWIAACVSWRRSRNERPGDAHQLIGSGDGRTRFMAMAGMMISALFLIAVAAAALNIAGTPPCGG